MGQIDFDGSNSTVKADVIRGQTGTTVKLGGLLDTDGNYIQTEKGGDLTSASPLVIDTDGSYFDVTGTTNFAAMTVAADRQFTLQFDGVLTMTHHATNLDLPGEANITTAAGDVATFQSTGSNTVQCINYTKADGTGVVSAGGGKVLQVIGATNAAETGSTSATYADTGITADITPVSTSNKVLVIISVSGTGKDSQNTSLGLKLLRDATTLFTNNTSCDTGDTGNIFLGAQAISYLDSPSSTSSLTYKVQMNNKNATGNTYTEVNNNASHITLMEIDGT